MTIPSRSTMQRQLPQKRTDTHTNQFHSLTRRLNHDPIPPSFELDHPALHSISSLLPFIVNCKVMLLAMPTRSIRLASKPGTVLHRTRRQVSGSERNNGCITRVLHYGSKHIGGALDILRTETPLRGPCKTTQRAIPYAYWQLNYETSRNYELYELYDVRCRDLIIWVTR